MSSKVLNTGLNFSGNRFYLSVASSLMQDKVAITLASGEVEFDINRDWFLTGGDQFTKPITGEIQKYLVNHTSPLLSVVLDPALYLYTRIPVNHRDLTQDELEQLVNTETERITGDKHNLFIFEWMPLKNDHILVFWIPAVVVSQLQILASRLGKKLHIVDFEPLAIMNLMNDRQFIPGEGSIHLVIGNKESGFNLLGFDEKEVVLYDHFIGHPAEDIPFYVHKCLNDMQIKPRSISRIFWYGKFTAPVLSGIRSVTGHQPKNLFENLKILYHRHSDTSAFTLENALPGIAVSYRTDA